jgi:hypothetical protein
MYGNTGLLVQPGAGNSYRIGHDAVTPYACTSVVAPSQRALRQEVGASLALQVPDQVWFLPRATWDSFPISSTAVLLLELHASDVDGAAELWQEALRAFDAEGQRLPFFYLLESWPLSFEPPFMASVTRGGPVAMVTTEIPYPQWLSVADRNPEGRALLNRGAALERIASDLGAKHGPLRRCCCEMVGILR